jgi:predicted alpha/beta superfamily hydrolase
MRHPAWIAVWLLAACSQSSTTEDASPPDGKLSPDRKLTPEGKLTPDARPVTTEAGSVDCGLDQTATASTVLRVHYPAGTGKLTVRGGGGPLSWTQGVSLTVGADDTWTFSTTAIVGTIEWKPLLDDQTWALGPNYHVTAGQTVEIYPRFSTQKGQVQKLIPGFSSTVLGNTRTIWAYLPPTYLENSRARMPVVYMHDGQNLFDPALAFGGNPWHADDAIDAAASSGTCASGSVCAKDSDCGGAGLCESFREAIIIGVENTVDRMDEYTPVPDPKYGGGKGDLYLKMLVDELKPKVDVLLRTRPEREHTALCGSSLGGLISAHAGVTRPDTFGLIGAMSPSTWWAGTAIIAEVKASQGKTPRPLRLYLDSGDAGASNDDVTNTNLLAATYLSIGFVEGKDFHHLVGHNDQHSEIYWAKRLPGALRFLLGPR